MNNLDSYAAMPPYLTRANDLNRLGLDGLQQSLCELYKQSAVLVIREWFDSHPEFNASFTVDYSGKKTFEVVSKALLSSSEGEALGALKTQMAQVCHPNNEMVFQHIIVLMNTFEWKREHLGLSLAAVLDMQTHIGASLFSFADARKLDIQSPQVSTQINSPRL